ncbi:helix-turn-helix domain-containing protein [Sphingosinicella sp. CPCC 101087]|uniref:winged helix-turn-helix transcriptional regulator n=1 Tax=Sphingosinicella sp. CPCC 101087 TaxID=2497754 RepID=UPI00101C8F8A|nr:helix-turn-helix domain-containing protein [Sphingosinicella sp. CPCC 101087]
MKDLVSRCPIEEVMRVLSGRWPTLLLYYLKDGPKRFGDLRRDNPTVSHRMLSLELRELEACGIVDRTEHGGYPRHVTYALTDAGRKLVPLIDALGDWWVQTEGDRAAAPDPAAGSARDLRTLPLQPAERSADTAA